MNLYLIYYLAISFNFQVYIIYFYFCSVITTLRSAFCVAKYLGV
uniref:Uncharacterized protein n=1 Tax=Polysiphonia sertularioides TaxID=945028 RepID=A0A1Z1MGM8_9FLOR|nr:hypothetical protein [Polysiphonia sertularioides]